MYLPVPGIKPMSSVFCVYKIYINNISKEIFSYRSHFKKGIRCRVVSQVCTLGFESM